LKITNLKSTPTKKGEVCNFALRNENLHIYIFVGAALAAKSAVPYVRVFFIKGASIKKQPANKVGKRFWG